MAKAKALRSGGGGGGAGDSNGSSASGRAAAHDERVGLLAQGETEEDGEEGEEEENEVRAPLRQKPTQLLIPTATAPPSAMAGSGGGSGRTPRTPNRVRFDLRPQVASSGSRPSSDSDSDSDIDMHTTPANRDSQGRRLPLLTGMEAPSVTMARDESEMDSLDMEDWAAQERARPKSGLRSAFMNMANSIIGAGIIGQPYALRQAGLGAGVVLLVVLTAAVDWTIRLIVVNSKLSGARSFQGTVERCFGRPGLVAISLAQWVFAFGGMVAFGVIVGDSIPHVLAAVWPGLAAVPVAGLLADRRAVIVVCLMGVSYPLALYRDIAKLAKASTFALASMGVIVVTVLVQGARVPAAERGSFSPALLTVNGGVFQAIGVISFAFVCHHNSLLIYGSLETPTMDRFSRVTHLSTAVSMVACLVMALAGFLTFGDRTLGNVLNNFSADNTMVNVARLCFGLNMLTTLPLEAFVCREVMLNYYCPGQPFSRPRHLAVTTGLVVGAMALSLVTCDLGAIFELVGATSACAMAYILPPLCYIKLTSARTWRTYLAGAIVVFGCSVMGISLIQAVQKLMRGQGGTAQCR